MNESCTEYVTRVFVGFPVGHPVGFADGCPVGRLIKFNDRSKFKYVEELSGCGGKNLSKSLNRSNIATLDRPNI